MASWGFDFEAYRLDIFKECWEFKGMKTIAVIFFSFLALLPVQSFAVPNNPAACQKWDPPKGATWRYRVTKNFKIVDNRIVFADGDWYRSSDWEGTKIYEKNAVYSYALPVGYDGTSRWMSKYEINQEHAKCSAVPKCDNPETITVPAGTFVTCKWTFNDPWGAPAYTVYTAPNIPIDGNVRIERRLFPDDNDGRIIHYDLIEVK